MNNNCLFNAAFLGFFQGAMSGSWIRSEVSADYAALKNAAVAFATQVDSGIPFDATITTGAGDPTMLFAVNQTQQSNGQFKTQLLMGICRAATLGRYTQDAVAANYDDIADACTAAYTQALTGLVSP